MNNQSAMLLRGMEVTRQRIERFLAIWIAITMPSWCLSNLGCNLCLSVWPFYLAMTFVLGFKSRWPLYCLVTFAMTLFYFWDTHLQIVWYDKKIKWSGLFECLYCIFIIESFIGMVPYNHLSWHCGWVSNVTISIDFSVHELALLNTLKH